MSHPLIPEHQRRIRLKFRLLAYFYDSFDLPFIFDRRTNPRLVLAHKVPNAPLSVLDVCVGTAIGSMAVAEANPKNRITGIDLSLDMLALAQEKIRRRGLRNVSLRQMDAANMQFGESAFDVVMVSFGMHELGEDLMLSVLKEMNRVLRKGGKLLVMDYARQGGRWANLFFSLYLRVFEPRHIFRFLEYDWNEILSKSGFKIAEAESSFFAMVISATKVN
jgi:ubiquinone/menaquinone biosynthesis C-methylase UbiE